MKKVLCSTLLLAAVSFAGPAAARDYSLVGTWKLDNRATLDGIAKSRQKTESQTGALQDLYQGTTLCSFTESTWECQSSGNPSRKDWTRRGSYRLLRGDGIFKVVEFKVTQQMPQTADGSPVQHGVSLIRIDEDGYSIFRPNLDYWQALKRAAAPAGPGAASK